MTVESCTHNHAHSCSTPPKPASPAVLSPNDLPLLPNGLPLLPVADRTQQVAASESLAPKSTSSGSAEDDALVGVFDRITLRLESFETAQRTAVQQVRQELVAAIGELASTKRARATAQVEATRRDPFGYGWTYPLYAPYRAPYSPSDYSNLPPLVDHRGKIVTDSPPLAPPAFPGSQRTLEKLQAKSDAAYLRLVSKVNGEDWQVVDDPSSSSETDTDESTPLASNEEQTLSPPPPTLPVTPIIVSPSSSTAQSSNIIVNIPTLPFVSAASIADSSDISSECSSDDSDVSTSSEENDVEQQEEEEEHASVDLSCGSSSNSSDSSETESEDDEDEVEGVKEDYNPTVAKLEISLLRAKLKLAKLEYLRHCERNPTTVVAVEVADKGEKTECDDLWKWEERKASVDKLVAARRKASFEKELVRVYVAEVGDEVVVVEQEKPCSYLESIE
ncbi:hypothetical protein JCM5353_002942 [Sporobolomyces roseus]